MRCGNCGNELRGEARFCSVCGAPVAAAPPPFPGTPPRQTASTFGDAPRQPLSGAGGPRKKSGCGKVLLVLLVIGVLVAAGLGVAGYFAYRFAERKLKSSEAYTLAVDRLKADPEVAGRMGAIRETGFPLGNFEKKADGTGSAVFRMSVTGERASGNYDVVMSRAGGRWAMRSGKVTLKGGGEIDVAPDEEGGGETPEPPEPAGPPAGGAANRGRAVSGGVLNGKAVSKPEPAYPPTARAARASGAVVVQITVDESGRVVSASAVSGHPLLRQAAEQAARQARFTPTLLSGKPVRVTGTITYNFNPPAQ
jgi:TonB family protein